jgi:mannose/cellobiose epimerase-like protein (N-acyl-D-glucosamine 2-epimerase family)
MKFGGAPMPLNQQNTLGRTLTALARIPKDARYTDKARRLCTYFKVFLKKQGRGYVWNYWPTAY